MRKIINQVDYRDFYGLATNIDPQDIRGGATVYQENITCITPGELRTRKGMRNVTFAGDDSLTAGVNVLTLRYCPRPDAAYALVFTDDGKIKLKHSPT